MVSMLVKTEVPEDRKVVLTLPPEIPEGPVEIEVRILTPGQYTSVVTHYGPDGRSRSFPHRPTDPKLAQEHDLFEQMLPELMKAYAGQYVALHEGKIVEAGSSRVAVLTNAWKKLPGVMVYVRLVTDQPELLDRVTSRREVRSESA